MQELTRTITAVCQDLFGTAAPVELTRTAEQFGDFATNIALQMAGRLENPPAGGARAIAERLSETLRHKLKDQIATINVAGPGFINLKLSDSALWQVAQAEPAKTFSGKTVVAEYSDPNPFKVLHAGHLYTTITGDAIAKLLEQAGATVHRLNYGGDVGLHVGRSMWAIVRFLGGEHPEKLESVAQADERLEWLSRRYVEGTEAYETDDSAKAAIIEMNKRVYQLHADNDHDSPLARIYWTCRTWSYDGFNRLYDQLQVTPFEKYVPESEVTPLGIEIVQKGLREGVFEESDGAIIFRGEPHGLHTRVFINSGGLPTYETKDLGLAATKWQEYKFDLSLIITGNDIVEYMKVVSKALANFYPEIVARSKHLTHGMIKLPGGVKMSSRRGNTLRAVDILDAAREANIKTAGNENHETVLAAVKYAFLKQRIGGDIIYNPEESVATEGNSGPYLQYAHARARSILAKSHASSLQSQASPAEPLEAGERSLLRKIGEYAEVVDKAVVELMPHHVCAYLYELAQVFNSFYEHNRVIGDKRETLRLELVTAYADTLQKGLGLLNIPAPDKM